MHGTFIVDVSPIDFERIFRKIFSRSNSGKSGTLTFPRIMQFSIICCIAVKIFSGSSPSND